MHVYVIYACMQIGMYASTAQSYVFSMYVYVIYCMYIGIMHACICHICMYADWYVYN